MLILLLALGLWAMTDFYTNLPERLSQHETIVLGQSRLVPASQAAMRVVVRDSRDEAPLSGAAIKVSLQSDGGEAGVALFEGTTDELGTANVRFTVPEDVAEGQQLVVETESSLGSDRVERAVTLERDYRILLTTDKPLYQPGQEIHVRGLALGTFDRVPAMGEALEVIIADGKGNKVFRETVTTSEFGVASVDFQLASEVNTGPYKITAQLGNTFSEKTVTVERYLLPKFEVNLDTTQSYYLPGETVEGSLNATYFFGKPVANAAILVEGFTFDVERQDVLISDGTTDGEGNFDFDFQLPDYIAGSDLDGGTARFYLQVTVTDQTNHSESASLSLPVTQSRLVIEAIPEGGQFRPGVENILYVLTSYPDGTPAPTSLNL
jgi:5-hydroxyisourate hydrolase-like protein (transthyretin family)